MSPDHHPATVWKTIKINCIKEIKLLEIGPLTGKVKHEWQVSMDQWYLSLNSFSDMEYQNTKLMWQVRENKAGNE